MVLASRPVGGAADGGDERLGPAHRATPGVTADVDAREARTLVTEQAVHGAHRNLSQCSLTGGNPVVAFITPMIGARRDRSALPEVDGVVDGHLRLIVRFGHPEPLVGFRAPRSEAPRHLLAESFVLAILSLLDLGVVQDL